MYLEKKQATVTVLPPNRMSSIALVPLPEKRKHSREEGGVLGRPNGEHTNCPNANRAGGLYSYSSPLMTQCFPDPLVLPPDDTKFAFLSIFSTRRDLSPHSPGCFSVGTKAPWPVFPDDRGTTRSG